MRALPVAILLLFGQTFQPIPAPWGVMYPSVTGYQLTTPTQPAPPTEVAAQPPPATVGPKTGFGVGAFPPTFPLPAQVAAPVAGTQATVAIVDGRTTNFTDSTGQVWTPDTSTPNVTFQCTGTNATYGVTAQIGGALPAAPDQPLYQNERYGACNFTFSGLTNGTYTWLGKFAELYWTAAGKRIFNVTLNGVAVLTAFDIFSTAGGEFKAIDKSFSVVVTNGTLVVGFIVGGADLPKIDAQALYLAQPAAPPAPPGGGQATITATPGTLTITGTNNQGATEQIVLNSNNPIQLTFAPNAHMVTLTWSASTSTEVTGYAVFRSQSPNAPVTSAPPLTVITQLTYVDTAVLPGQTYYYVVTALAPACPPIITITTPPCGQSAPSNQVQAVIPTP